MQTESVRPPRVKISHYFCYPKQDSNFNQIYSNFQANYDSKAINHCEFFLLALLKNSPMKRFQILGQSFPHLGKPVKLSPLHITSDRLWPEVPEYFDA